MSVASVLRELVEKSLGELERVVLTTADGMLIAASNPSDVDDIVAALGAAVVAGVSDAFKQYFSTGVRDIFVELEDGKVFLMRDLDGPVLCLFTKPRPNLGLIYYLLDKHTDKVRSATVR